MSDTDNERINHIVGQISGISREHKERQTEFFDIQEEITLASQSLNEFDDRLTIAQKESQTLTNQRDILAQDISKEHRQLAEKDSRLQVLKALLVDGQGLSK